MDSVSLIRSKEPVTQLVAPPPRDPTVAVVYADHLGGLHLIGDGQPVGRWDQFRARYKTRYEVEMADFTRKARVLEAAPLAADGIHHFETTLIVSFRVRDPVTVLRRGIEDPRVPVYAYVLHACRNIAVRYGIEQAREAERDIESHFAHTVRLEEGIDIFRVQARLSLDVSTRGYLGTVEGAGRQKDIDAVKHEVTVAAARGEIELADMRQTAAIAGRARESRALDGRPMDMVDFIRLMLERDPDNLEAPKQLLLEVARSTRERQEQQDERIQHLFDVMAEHDILRREDVDSFRDQLSGAGRPPSADERPAIVDWDSPLPSDSKERPFGPTVMPIYLALDESLAHIAELDAVVASVYETLAKTAAVAGVIQLSVVGFADETAVRKPLGPLDVSGAATSAPRLRAGGPPRFGPLFDRLRELIESEVGEIKTRRGAVGRPQVIVLTGGQPDDPVSWASAHARLVDRDTNPFAPEIIAVGLDGANPGTVDRIATRYDMAFLADRLDAVSAIAHFGSFVCDHLVRTGRAVLDGDSRPYILAPRGFRRTTDSTNGR